MLKFTTQTFRALRMDVRKNGPSKKMALLVLLWGMCHLLAPGAFAQAPGYTFGAASGTYSAISGGTQLSTGSAMDDATFSVTLPFNFNFNGTVYTQVYLSENGYLSFGSTNPGTSTRSAISSTTTGFELAAALSGDLQGINSASELRYEVTGSAPNRIFVAQWTNQQFYLASSQSFNFQIRLEEANGVASNQVVRFVYGTVSNSGTSGTVQVGLRGTTNSSYLNRTTTTNWSSTTAGSTNADACTVSSTVAPASGLTFTWTPIPMTYTSSTTTQALTTPVVPGSTSQQIIGVQVVTSGVASPLSLTALALNTTGTTAVSDILNAKVYYTGTSSTFSTSTQFGSTVTSPSGSFSVTGTQALSNGTNYFWVTYDISSSATLGNVVDAQCTQITVSSSNYTPTVTNPAGTRAILGPLNGTYTVGAGGNFTTLTQAANTISAAGVTGPVTFNLIDNNYSTNETFPITFGVITGASSTNTLTIKPATGVTSIITGSATSILAFNGADYVTLNGSNSNSNTIDLNIFNNSTATSAVISFGSLGVGSGATNNTIKNCYIRGGSSTATGVIGISVANTTISTSGTGADNDNLTITNNYVTRAYYGIFARGVASTGMNDNLIISNNFIGDPVSANTVTFAGIDVQNASNPLIQSNNISNMAQASGVSTNPCAIAIGGTITTGYIIGNIINGVRNPSSGGWGAYGINIAGTITTMNIINNDISDISTMNYSTTSTTYNAFGIRITVGGTYNIYNNSVNLFGAVPNVGSTAHFSAAILFISGTTVDLRNNVFVNSQTGLTGAKSYAIYSTVANTVFAATTNRNDYFVSGSNGVLGYIGATDQTTLTAWQTAIASSKDANSISSNPTFNASNNLRPVSGSPLLGAGATVSGITTDLRGVTRNTTTPTIGAYEIAGEFITPVVSFTQLNNTVSTSNRTTVSFATITDASGINTTAGTKPRLYYKKSTNANALVGNTSADNGWKWVEANNTTSPFDFTINYSLLTGGGVSPGEIIQYFVIAQDIAATPNVTWSTGGTTPFGFNTNPTSVAISAGNFPIWGNVPSYSIALQLSGTYLIGTGQQFTSLTNSGGFFDYINNNAIAGNVVGLVTSNLTELGTVALNPAAEVNGSGYTISIQPSAPAQRFISGSYAGGLVRMNGADRIVIDGRFNGSGSTNYFTFANNQASGTTGCIQLISLGNGAGATNNTIRNCNFVMPRTGVSSGAIFAGGTTINTAGSDNDSLTIMNNYIQSAAAGVVVTGTSGFECDLVSIIGNSVDTSAQVGFSLSAIRSLVLTGNAVNNITSASGVTPAGINIGANVRNGVVSQNIIQNVVSLDQNCWGISVGTSDSNLFISRNSIRRVIHNGTSGWGGKGIDINTGLASSAIYIVNNMITNVGGDGYSSIGSDANVGIRINGATGGIRVLHNTVNMYGTWSRTGASADISAALAITSATPTNIEVRNNILCNSIMNTTGTQVSYAIYSAATAISQFSNINYNNYFVTGTQGTLGYFNGAARATLANWKSAVTTDLYSQNQAVNFVDSTADVRLTGTSIGDLYLRSVPVSGVTVDNLGNNRGIAMTYMGAHEASAFAGLTVNAGADTTMCAGSSYTLGGATVATGGVASYSYSWTSGASAVANPVVSPTSTTTYILTATDAMNFSGMDTVVVTVNPAPSAPTASAPAIVCYGSTATLTATGTGTFVWYKNPSGGSALGTGASYVTPALTTNDSFYVSATQSGCTSSRTGVSVNLTIPTAPTANAVSTCSGTTATLSATGAGTFVWYKNPSGGSALGTGSSYTTSVLTANDSFYVEAQLSGCSSSRTKVNVTVNSLPSAPTVNTPSPICSGTNTIIVSSGAGTKNWYSASTGGTLLSTGDTLTTSILASNATYYVSVTNGNGCISATRTPVTVTVNSIPSAPSIGSPAAICAGNVAKIIATPASGSRRWYAAYIGGTVIYSGDTFTTGVLTSNATYYAENIVNGCVSVNRTPVTVSVNPIPAFPTVAAASICEGSTATLTATGFSTGDSINWYDAATAGNMVGTGATYISGALTAGTSTFYAGIKSAAGCSNAGRTPGVITVNVIPSAPAVNGTTICEATSATLDFSALPGSLKWYDDSTGTVPSHTGSIYTSATMSANDTFYVSTTVSGCESSRNQLVIAVTPLPAKPVAANTAICEGHPATLSATGSSPIAWYLTATGGTSVDTGNAIIVNGITNTTVYFAESHNGVCASATRTPVVVVFNSKPDAAFTVLGQLAGQVTFKANALSGVNYNWNFGNSTTSTAASPACVYATNGNYNVKLVVINPTTGCSDSTTTNVTVGTVGTGNKVVNGMMASAYPNPFENNTTIDYTISQAAIVSVKIVDLMGREVMDIPAGQQQAGNYQINWNSEHLSAGVYYVRLNINGQNYTLRLVKAQK